MSDSPLEELDAVTRRAVELSRQTPIPEADLAAALARIASLAPPPPRAPAWREPLRRAAAAAVVILLVGGGLFSRAPAAWAEVAAARLSLEAQPGAAPAPPAEGQPVRKLRGLLLVHVVSLLAGYAAYALAWLVSCAVLLTMLFTDGLRLYRVARRVSTALLAPGVLLMLVGILLGCVWSKEHMGRYWGWDVKETNALTTLLAGVLWLVGNWQRWRTVPQGVWRRIEPGVLAAVCFWTAMGGWWLIAFVGKGVLLWQTGLCLGLCILGNVALLAGAWWAQRAVSTAEA